MFVSPNILANYGISAIFSTIMYFFASMRSSHKNNSLTIDAAMQPHIIMVLPLFNCGGLEFWAIFFSNLLHMVFQRPAEECRITVQNAYITRSTINGFWGLRECSFMKNIHGEHLASSSVLSDQRSWIQLWWLKAHFYCGLVFMREP